MALFESTASALESTPGYIAPAVVSTIARVCVHANRGSDERMEPEAESKAAACVNDYRILRHVEFPYGGQVPSGQISLETGRLFTFSPVR